MANTAQAKKRARQAEKHRQRNASQRSEMRTYTKRVVKSAAEGQKKVLKEEQRLATSKLDKAAQKGLIHKRTADRLKSRMNKRTKAVLLGSKTA